MTNPEPWAALPPQVADVLEPELPAITDAILRAIGEEVPEYARPLEGAFGRDVRTGAEPHLHRPGPRGAARRPHARRAAVGVPHRRARGLAADSRRERRRRLRPR